MSGGGRIGGDNPRQAAHAAAVVELLKDRPVWDQAATIERRWADVPMPDEALYGILSAMRDQGRAEDTSGMCIACAQGAHTLAGVGCRSPGDCPCRRCARARGRRQPGATAHGRG